MTDIGVAIGMLQGVLGKRGEELLLGFRARRGGHCGGSARSGEEEREGSRRALKGGLGPADMTTRWTSPCDFEWEVARYFPLDGYHSPFV